MKFLYNNGVFVSDIREDKRIKAHIYDFERGKWRLSKFYTFDNLIKALSLQNCIPSGTIIPEPKQEYLSKSKYKYPCPLREGYTEDAFKDEESFMRTIQNCELQTRTKRILGASEKQSRVSSKIDSSSESEQKYREIKASFPYGKETGITLERDNKVISVSGRAREQGISKGDQIINISGMTENLREALMHFNSQSVNENSIGTWIRDEDIESKLIQYSKARIDPSEFMKDIMLVDENMYNGGFIDMYTEDRQRVRINIEARTGEERHIKISIGEPEKIEVILRRKIKYQETRVINRQNHIYQVIPYKFQQGNRREFYVPIDYEENTNCPGAEPYAVFSSNLIGVVDPKELYYNYGIAMSKDLIDHNTYGYIEDEMTSRAKVANRVGADEGRLFETQLRIYLQQTMSKDFIKVNKYSLTNANECVKTGDIFLEGISVNKIIPRIMPITIEDINKNMQYKGGYRIIPANLQSGPGIISIGAWVQPGSESKQEDYVIVPVSPDVINIQGEEIYPSDTDIFICGETVIQRWTDEEYNELFDPLNMVYVEYRETLVRPRSLGSQGVRRDEHSEMRHIIIMPSRDYGKKPIEGRQKNKAIRKRKFIINETINPQETVEYSFGKQYMLGITHSESQYKNYYVKARQEDRYLAYINRVPLNLMTPSNMQDFTITREQILQEISTNREDLPQIRKYRLKRTLEYIILKEISDRSLVNTIVMLLHDEFKQDTEIFSLFLNEFIGNLLYKDTKLSLGL